MTNDVERLTHLIFKFPVAFFLLNVCMHMFICIFLKGRRKLKFFSSFWDLVLFVFSRILNSGRIRRLNKYFQASSNGQGWLEKGFLCGHEHIRNEDKQRNQCPHTSRYYLNMCRVLMCASLPTSRPESICVQRTSASSFTAAVIGPSLSTLFHAIYNGKRLQASVRASN